MLDLLITHATLPDGRRDMSVAVQGERIVQVRPAWQAPAHSTVDAGGLLLSPPFVDAHFHLDSALTYGQPRTNASGTLLEGIALWGELKPQLTYEAIVERALRYCDWAVARGLLAIRSHVDTSSDHLLAVQALLEKYFIVRISWVFGVNGRNFIRTMLKLSETHDELTVVDDQVGSPTYTRDLAVLLADMAASSRYGVYHATNEGVCSWAELAAEVFRQAGRSTTVTPVSSSAYPTKAIRPKNSRLSKDCLDEAGFQRLPRWQDAVGRYLIELCAN